MDEKKQECGYPYADCRFRDELRTLRAANKNLGKQLQDVEEALNNETAKRLGESTESAALKKKVEDPSWADFIEITRNWLTKYPPDIFTGVSGDSGPVFVVAIRGALAELDSAFR